MNSIPPKVKLAIRQTLRLSLIIAVTGLGANTHAQVADNSNELSSEAAPSKGEHSSARPELALPPHESVYVTPPIGLSEPLDTRRVDSRNLAESINDPRSKLVQLREYRKCIVSKRDAASLERREMDLRADCKAERETIIQDLPTVQKQEAERVQYANEEKVNTLQEEYVAKDANRRANARDLEDIPRGYNREERNLVLLGDCIGKAERTTEYTASDCTERLGLTETDLQATQDYVALRQDKTSDSAVIEAKN